MKCPYCQNKIDLDVQIRQPAGLPSMVTDILAKVAIDHGMPAQDILSGKQLRYIVAARRDFIGRLKKSTGWTNYRIAKMLRLDTRTVRRA